MKQVQNPFLQEDNEFLDGLNSGPEESRIYLTAQHGYMRNLDRGQLQQLENIYKRTINPDFVLCFHCSHDVLKATLDVYREREKYMPAAEDAPPAMEEHKLTEQDFADYPYKIKEPMQAGDVISYPAGTNWIDAVAAFPSAPASSEGTSTGAEGEKDPASTEQKGAKGNPRGKK